MDISLIIAPISLKMCMCIAKICMEGSASQNTDLGLSFCFMQCRRRHSLEGDDIKGYAELTDTTLLLAILLAAYLRGFREKIQTVLTYFVLLLPLTDGVDGRDSQRSLYVQNLQVATLLQEVQQGVINVLPWVLQEQARLLCNVKILVIIHDQVYPEIS